MSLGTALRSLPHNLQNNQFFIGNRFPTTVTSPDQGGIQSIDVVRGHEEDALLHVPDAIERVEQTGQRHSDKDI